MSETWVIKDSAPVDGYEAFIICNISFVSNNENFTSFTVENVGFDCTLVYDNEVVAGVNMGDPQAGGVFEWENYAYKTVVFDSAPTGDLLAWLTKNADLIAGEEAHRYQDMHLSDVELNTKFKQYMANGQYADALNILKNDQLTDKMIVGALFNYVTTRIIDVQSISDPTFKQDRIKIAKTPPADMKKGQAYFKLKE